MAIRPPDSASDYKGSFSLVGFVSQVDNTGPHSFLRSRSTPRKKTMIVKRTALALLTLTVVLFGRAGAPAAASQRTLFVDDDKQQCPMANYTSINEAIIAAAPGDKIVVCPGVYSETVVVN